jgi:hypothetical protein
MNDAGQAKNEVIVRGAGIADGQAIADIYAHHVLNGTASFDTVPRTLEQTEQKIADILAHGWPFLVAEREGVIIGLCLRNGISRPARLWLHLRKLDLCLRATCGAGDRRRIDASAA